MYGSWFGAAAFAVVGCRAPVPAAAPIAAASANAPAGVPRTTRARAGDDLMFWWLLMSGVLCGCVSSTGGAGPLVPPCWGRPPCPYLLSVNGRGRAGRRGTRGAARGGG